MSQAAERYVIRLKICWHILIFTVCCGLCVATPSNQPFIVFDAHEDPIGRLLDRGDDLSDPLASGQVDIPKWRAGKLNIVWLAIWVDPRRYSGQAAFDRANALIDRIESEVRRHRSILALCRTSDECLAAARQGKIAILLGLEGGEPLLGSPETLEHFCRRGIRRVTLTWRGDLSWAGSSQNWDQSAVRREKGLSDVGKQFVRKMNDLGIVVDLSHTSEATAKDVLRITEKPVIFSHSNCKALANHPRNVSDHLLKNLQLNGGVIGINFHTKFLTSPKRPFFFTQRAQPSIKTVADHIDHARRVAGIDHVGIGSDWDGDITPALGLKDASTLPKLWAVLRGRGYTEEEIRKVAGENFLRVLRENEHR